jgi:hypothetical protein
MTEPEIPAHLEDIVEQRVEQRWQDMLNALCPDDTAPDMTSAEEFGQFLRQAIGRG